MPIYTTTRSSVDAVGGPSPRCLQEYLANGQTEGDRNNTLFKIACQCHHAGLSRSEVEESLVSRAVTDGLSESEARKTVRSAFEREQRAPPHGAGKDAAPFTPAFCSSSSNTRAKKSLAKTSAPRPLPNPIPDGFKVLLETCFQPEEKIVIGKGSDNIEGKLDIDAGTMNTRESWLKRFATKPVDQQYACYKDGIFLRINPMKGNGKADIDVARWRHCLVEFDLDATGEPVPKEFQYAVLLDSRIPIAAVIDSGNKSLQALVVVDAQNRKEYDERREQVADYFSQFAGFDGQNKNPSRYCRCPGLERNLYQNGKLTGTARQELLAIRIGPASWAEYEKAEELTEEELQRLTEERRDYYTQKEPPFPEPMNKEAYYGITGEVVDIITAQSEACPESILIQFQVGMMNILGRTPYRRQAGMHHLNEFAVLVGETSTGCKGASWDAVNALLEAVDPDWYQHRIHTGIQSGEAIISLVRDSKVKTLRNGKRIIIEGVSDKRLLIFEDEFPRLLMVANRQGNTLSPVLREVFDGKKVLETASKNDPEKATGALISVLGHGTPEEMRKNLSVIDATNGFANRLLLIAVRGIGEVPIPSAIDWVHKYPAIVGKLQVITRNFHTRPSTHLEWTEAGEAAWIQYYREHRKRKLSGLIDPIIRRSLAHTLRLTMGYALLDNVIGMNPDHLAAARAVVAYSERSAQWTFGQKLGDRGADKALWELNRRPLGMTKSEISSEIFKNNASATEINMKLALLRDNNLADYQLERVAGTKKPVERWFSLRYRNKTKDS
jgi:hypothetical protein